MLNSRENQTVRTGQKGTDDLIYAVDDNPPWYECLIYGFQHYLAMVGGTIAIPIVVASYLCMEESNPARADLVSAIIFVAGIITLLQSTLGVRLPIIQGGNFAYVIPLIALLTSTFKPCESLPMANMTMAEKEEAWQIRMREVQGVIAISALVQIFIGFTGIIGILLTWITPLTIVPTITLVGLSVFQVASAQGSGHWGIYMLTIILCIIFSQHMRDVNVPCPIYKRGQGLIFIKCQPFKTLPFLLALLLVWALSAILSFYDLIPEGSPARTDAASSVIKQAPWFRIPYPGQWGVPTVSVAGVLGMIAAVFSSVMESIGDYYACARVSGAPMPPTHAINRGIGVEGIGCMLAGLWGTGSGTTSYSGNIGILAITKVGSRRVIQYAAGIMIACGIFGKMGAIFVTIPEPIIGAILTIKFSIITAVGISSVQSIDLSSSRNIFVLGFSIFFALSTAKWVEENPHVIDTGYILLDQTLLVLLQTSMFIGGLTGLILDNSIPGTDEERGILHWKGQMESSSEDTPTGSSRTSCYNLPYSTNILKKITWAKYIPFCQTFEGFSKKPSREETHC